MALGDVNMLAPHIASCML